MANLIDFNINQLAIGNDRLRAHNCCNNFPKDGSRYISAPDLPTWRMFLEGHFALKKRDLPAKSGTVGRAHIEIFLEVGPYTAYRNQLRSKIKHGDSAAVTFGIFAKNRTEFP